MGQTTRHWPQLTHLVAASHDARGINRVTTVNVYPQDAPEEYCDKHVDVTFCVTGGGVANEYCALFPEVTVQTRSLVYQNRYEIDALNSADNVGLVDIHTFDGYVYFVDENGEPAPWHGFRGAFGENTMPYLQCAMHNQQSYEMYLQMQNGFVGGDGSYYPGDGNTGFGDVIVSPDGGYGGDKVWDPVAGVWR